MASKASLSVLGILLLAFSALLAYSNDMPTGCGKPCPSIIWSMHEQEDAIILERAPTSTNWSWYGVNSSSPLGLVLHEADSSPSWTTAREISNDWTPVSNESESAVKPGARLRFCDPSHEERVVHVMLLHYDSNSIAKAARFEDVQPCPIDVAI